jgi:hypothetical protein
MVERTLETEATGGLAALERLNLQTSVILGPSKTEAVTVEDFTTDILRRKTYPPKPFRYLIMNLLMIKC